MLRVVVVLLIVPLGLDLYMPIPEENPVTADKIELGRRLFHDRRLSRDASLSCASCHDPDRAFTNGRPVSIGVFGRRGTRNVPAIINRGYGRAFFWDGRIPTLEEQVLQPIQNPIEMDLTIEEAADRVGLEPKAIAQALATYVRSVLSGDSPYDRFANGDGEALTADEQAGLGVFRGKGNCTACHTAPTFTDETPHNTGVAWRNGRLTDPGAGRGDFKTPTLREVARTAPYMHDGSLATLAEVIEFYDGGGRANPNLDNRIQPLGLTEVEQRQLEAFLRALSGQVTEGSWVRDQTPRPSRSLRSEW